MNWQRILVGKYLGKLSLWKFKFSRLRFELENCVELVQDGLQLHV